MADKCQDCGSEVGQFGVTSIKPCSETGLKECDDCHDNHAEDQDE